MKSSNEFESVVVDAVVVNVDVVGQAIPVYWSKPHHLQFWIPPAAQPNPPSIGGVEEHSGS